MQQHVPVKWIKIVYPDETNTKYRLDLRKIYEIEA